MAVAAGHPRRPRMFVCLAGALWWRFPQHQIAVAPSVVVAGFLPSLDSFGRRFLAYADPDASEPQRALMPPSACTRFRLLWGASVLTVTGFGARAIR